MRLAAVAAMAQKSPGVSSKPKVREDETLGVKILQRRDGGFQSSL
jgi:hypothetical protein